MTNKIKKKSETINRGKSNQTVSDEDRMILTTLKTATNVRLRRMFLLSLTTRRGVVQQKTLPSVAKQDAELEIMINREASKSLVHIKFSLSLSYGDKHGEANAEPALTIEALYELEYHFVTPITEEEEETYANSILQIAMTNAWPFWRELVHSMTSRMGLPGFPLPLLNPSKVAAMPKKITKNSGTKD